MSCGTTRAEAGVSVLVIVLWAPGGWADLTCSEAVDGLIHDFTIASCSEQEACILNVGQCGNRGLVTGEIEIPSLLANSHVHAHTLLPVPPGEGKGLPLRPEQLSQNDTSRFRAAGTESDDRWPRRCSSLFSMLRRRQVLPQALINERVMLCDKPLAYAAAPRVPCGSGPSDTCIICQLWVIDQVPQK